MHAQLALGVVMDLAHQPTVQMEVTLQLLQQAFQAAP
jgi:hypothetical protein